MAGLKISVHPLFYVFGLYCALTGKIFVFATYTISALLHETGHSYAAGRFGYKLNRITLMPYGASVKGDIDGLRPKDEIAVAFAGPLVNAVVCVLFTALWWFFPDVYPYTETAATANFGLAAVNLLPVYPLDGGRIFYALIKGFTSNKAADIICMTGGVICSAAFLGLFIFSAFGQANVSLLFFAAFILFGVFEKKKQSRYVKISSIVSARPLTNGLRVNKYALSGKSQVKTLVRIVGGDGLYEIDVYDKDKKIKTLSQREISAVIENNGIYETLENALKKL